MHPAAPSACCQFSIEKFAAGQKIGMKQKEYATSTIDPIYFYVVQIYNS
jgi:hypothetical protein